jgi:hypothetical protein
MPIDDERAAWLKGLAVGDEVATGSESFPRRGRVVEATAVSLLVESRSHGCIRMRRSNGYDWHPCNFPDVLYPLADRIDLIDRNEITERLRYAKWHDLTVDQLRRIRAIVDEGTANDNEN